MTPILSPLAPYRDQLLVLSGFANMEADSWAGEGTGDHCERLDDCSHIYQSLITCDRPYSFYGANLEQPGPCLERSVAPGELIGRSGVVGK